MPSIWRAHYLMSRRCHYGWWGSSHRILLKISICLIYRELITSGTGNTTSLGAGAATTASRVVAREFYLVSIYLIYKELITLAVGAAAISCVGK
jgi:hypothetical protein